MTARLFSCESLTAWYLAMVISCRCALSWVACSSSCTFLECHFTYLPRLVTAHFHLSRSYCCAHWGWIRRFCCPSNPRQCRLQSHGFPRTIASNHFLSLHFIFRRYFWCHWAESWLRDSSHRSVNHFDTFCFRKTLQFELESRSPWIQRYLFRGDSWVGHGSKIVLFLWIEGSSVHWSCLFHRWIQHEEWWQDWVRVFMQGDLNSWRYKNINLSIVFS